jgi:mitogen-activated protein kinase 15
LKIADFGLARSIEYQEEETEGQTPVLTDYVATRWYRAPEILLGSGDYTKGVDMWSVGCILAEMLRGEALFPGDSTLNQIEKIMEVFGRPTAEDIEAINSTFAASMLDSLPDGGTIALTELFPNSGEGTLDILTRLLAVNPDKRLTVDESLNHSYVEQFHSGNEDEEVVCEKKIQIPINDNKKLNVAAYRNELYANVIKVAQVQKIKRKETGSKTKKHSSKKRPELSPHSKTTKKTTKKKK